MAKRKYTYDYPRPSVTVDCVVFGYEPSAAGGRRLKVLLIRRKDPPDRGLHALPGGFVEVSDGPQQGESLDAAAHRELSEETGIPQGHFFLEQLYTFGTPGRDPRGRVISVAYYALVRTDQCTLTAGSDASHVAWHTAYGTQFTLAFDHQEILAMAHRRLVSKIRYEPIGLDLLPEEFTMTELLELYEAILGREIDSANFRRAMKKILAAGVILESGDAKRGQHRPAKKYRFDREAYKRARDRGFQFEMNIGGKS